MTTSTKGIPGVTKPPLVPSAWVVLVDDVHAEQFEASKQGQYEALDRLTASGSSVTLASKVGDLEKVLSNVDDVTVQRVESLEAANNCVDIAPKDALVVVAITGDGDWSSYYNQPQALDDDFPLPSQSAGQHVVACGVACFAAFAKTRIDYREWLADKTFPGEGIISAAQLAEEILSKVGEKPKFGA